jgi:NAD(P)-dependent dehydrogenase (short-subunit alcohol dehydrogenase family)
MQNKLNPKAILITGAAAGIGQATARFFAAKGWFVGLYDVDEAGVKALASELGTQNAIAGKLDVANSDDWNAALEAFFLRTGRLDVLLNNAGILASGPFESIPLERQQQIIDINVKGVLNGCYHALPYLRRTPQSRVINMASASAIYGQPSLASYSASKFAVRGLTEALDLEWQVYGIKVMDVMPLFVQTGMLKDARTKAIASLGINLTPEDVAKTVWQAACYKGMIPRVHWLVGAQARLLYSLVGLTPDWLNRMVTRRIATND